MREQNVKLLALALLVAVTARGADKIKLVDGREFAGKIILKGRTFTVNAEEKWYQFDKYEVQEYKGELLNPVVKITTDKGDMLAVLYEDEVPNTVANMISLAESGYYKGMSFHRIIPKFMAQGGCPNSKKGAKGVPGTGGPGYKFADEIRPHLRHTGRGILSMANSGPGTNGSQFFICFKDTPHLNDKHTVFGKLITGQAVLDQLEAIGGPGGKPTEVVRFNVEVVAKKDHPYVVKKLD